MEQYISTRDSGVEGIGTLPSSWNIKSFSKVNWIRARLGWKGLKADEYVDNGFPLLSAFNLVNNRLIWEPLNYINQERYDESPEIKLSVGDILLVKDGAGIGKVARIDELPLGESTVNSSLAVITARPGLDYRFLYYFLLSPLFSNIITRLRNGMGVPHLTQESMKEIKMPFPSIKEQGAIAAYLDDQVAQIDSIIAEARASIEEYKQWREAIIYETVCKGIFVHTSFRDTGNMWLKSLPSGIKLSRVGLHFELILGKMLCPNQLDANYSLESYYCAANVHFNGVDETELKQMWFSPDEKTKYLVQRGDLLVVEGGAGAGGCSIAHPSQDTYIQNSIMIVRPRRGMDVRYVKYLLEMLVKRGYVDFVCNKATIPHFTKEKLANTPLPVFPENEVKAMCDHIDEQYKKIDSIIAEKEALISDLGSYKQSLIYEVITGKRKVV